MVSMQKYFVLGLCRCCAHINHFCCRRTTICIMQLTEISLSLSLALSIFLQWLLFHQSQSVLFYISYYIAQHVIYMLCVYVLVYICFVIGTFYLSPRRYIAKIFQSLVTFCFSTLSPISVLHPHRIHLHIYCYSCYYFHCFMCGFKLKFIIITVNLLNNL